MMAESRKEMYAAVLMLLIVDISTAECRSGGERFVKKTSRKYNFPLIKNNLGHYFYFLPFQHSEVLI